MIDIVLAMLLQAQPPAEPVADKKPEPEVVCTMEPITGTRAKKQKICRTPGYLKGAERTKAYIGGITGGSGNVQPPEPPALRRPGGPGY